MTPEMLFWCKRVNAWHLLAKLCNSRATPGLCKDQRKLIEQIISLTINHELPQSQAQA